MSVLKLATCVVACVFMISAGAIKANAGTVRLTIENIGPDGGNYLTPVFAGFHGATNFNLFDSGAMASVGLQSLAEDGGTSGVTGEFGAATAGAGVSQTIFPSVGMQPFAPGNSNFHDFSIASDGSNSFLSLASMVLPSSDFFLGTENAWDISSVINGAGPLTFTLGLPGTVWDAGTEVNDFATSAANGLFPGLGGGQSGPNIGADEGAGISLVTSSSAYDGYLNAPANFENDFAALNFNNTGSGGLLRVTVSAVPEPASAAIFGALGITALLRRRRRSWTAASKSYP